MAEHALSPASEGLGFEDLMTVMNTLAGKQFLIMIRANVPRFFHYDFTAQFFKGAGSGVGHLGLFRSCCQWLETCKNYLVEKNVIEKLEKNIPSGRHLVMVQHTCMLLNYVS